MKYVGYIGTALSFGIAGIIQAMPGIDEMAGFLAWALPAIVSIVGWFLQLVMTWKKMRKAIVNDIKEQVVNEMWERLDTFSKIKKRIEEHEEPA